MGTAIHWFWCKPVPGSRTWKIGRAKSGSFYCQTWKGVQYSSGTNVPSVMLVLVGQRGVRQCSAVLVVPGYFQMMEIANKRQKLCWIEIKLNM